MYVHILAYTLATPILTLANLDEQQVGGALEVTDANFRKAGSTVRLVFTGSYSLTYSLVEVLESDALVWFLSSNELTPSHMCACEMLNRNQTKYTVEIMVSIKVILMKNVFPLELHTSTAITINGGSFNRFALCMI